MSQGINRRCYPHLIRTRDFRSRSDLASLPDLAAKFPGGTWSYRFFVDDGNAFTHISLLDGEP